MDEDLTKALLITAFKFPKIIISDTNQNYDEILPHTSQNGHYQKNLQIINAGESVEKRDPSELLECQECKSL